MRQAIASLARYVVTSAVAKHRIFAWQPRGTLPHHQLLVFAREDDYFFGVLHSRAHEARSLRLGTSLEDRPRYTPTTCFETFPLPWLPGTEPVDDPRVIADEYQIVEHSRFEVASSEAGQTVPVEGIFDMFEGQCVVQDIDVARELLLGAQGAWMETRFVTSHE